MTHDAAGTVLDVGRRTRTIPPAIRRALARRDRGCRFPGCHNRYADAHHLRHWADGGPTSLENLVLLCRRHHRAVHEGGYRVTTAADGELTFRCPDGAVLPQVPRMPASPHAWPTEGRRVADTPYERLDLDWTIYMLYRPRSVRDN